MRQRLRTPRMTVSAWTAIIVLILAAIILPSFITKLGASPAENELIQWKIRAIFAICFIPTAWWMARMELIDQVRDKLQGHSFLGSLYHTKDDDLEVYLKNLRRTLGYGDMPPDFYVVGVANALIRRMSWHDGNPGKIKDAERIVDKKLSNETSL